jgi:chromosome partitioning protein
MSQQQKPPYVIAIANQKGGVAKTTTVVSLAGALVQNDKEVLVIDLDAQANLTLALGKDPARLRGSVAEVLYNNATLLSTSRETAIPGLDLVPANSSMETAERFLPMRQNYETILKRAIQDAIGEPEAAGSMPGQPPGAALADHPPAVTSQIDRSTPTAFPYDFVLLDCPPIIGAVTVNALAAADLLIIPSQPEYFSAHALRTMITTVRQAQNSYNPDLAYRILITMLDRRNRIHRQVTEHIRAAFGEHVFHTVIEIDTKLRESAVEGLPISYHRSASRSALQYNALAQELIPYVAA